MHKGTPELGYEGKNHKNPLTSTESYTRCVRCGGSLTDTINDLDWVCVYSDCIFQILINQFRAKHQISRQNQETRIFILRVVYLFIYLFALYSLVPAEQR